MTDNKHVIQNCSTRNVGLQSPLLFILESKHVLFYVMSPLGFVFGVDTIVNNLNSPEQASELCLMAHLNETGQRYLEKALYYWLRSIIY